MKEFAIGKNDAGQRLDRFVGKAVPLLPASLVQKYIRLKRIKVDGKKTKGSHMLSVGEIVAMYINDDCFISVDPLEEPGPPIKKARPPLEIVYEDKNILLINKQAGVLCHSGNKHDNGSVIAMILAYLAQKGEWRRNEENAFRPALCNRVDRNTSGIIIAAKNAESLRIINEKIKLREIDKYYLAVVCGIPTPPSGKLEGNIIKDTAKNRVICTKDNHPGTKTASADYKTIATSGQLSLLECRLITGRTHQIRAQLADIGHPLLGDGKYGNAKVNKSYGEQYQMLCSYKLAFTFKQDAGPLQYLDKSTYELRSIPIIEKYFPTHGGK